jgi:16S rRNA (guanine527-N7)-methyltransferase
VALEAVGGVSVSRETIETLRRSRQRSGAGRRQSTSCREPMLENVWGRHIVDSAQIFQACPSGAMPSWLDLGSGGGFPGLVIAILARELQPNLHVTLVEADQRKAAFLRQTAQKLGLDVAVIAKRIESLSPQSADVVSARALAPLTDLLGLAAPHLKHRTAPPSFRKGRATPRRFLRRGVSGPSILIPFLVLLSMMPPS